MNYARWNFDNRPEGFETPKLGIFGAWESLVVCVHIFFFGSFILLLASGVLFATGSTNFVVAVSIGAVWLLFSTPFILWFRARFQQHQG
jgi:hypothetical protein